MILGIGVDIIEIERIKKLAERQEGFVSRLLTAKEQTYLSLHSGTRRGEFLAGRFASKEAASKALGTGIGKQIGFHDIEIFPDVNGKPELHINPLVMDRFFPEGRKIRFHISISHSREFAVAQVIMEQQ